MAAALSVAACSTPRPEASMSQIANACAAKPEITATAAPAPDLAALALLSRAEAFTVPVARGPFTAWFDAAPLETLLPGAAGIAAVTGTRPVGAPAFPAAGSRRLVCLADGSTAMEQVLAYEPGRRLRYVVWDYTTPAAAPIAYGVGEFRFADAPEGTAVEWTYAFRLKAERFPGSLGALGRGLFRLAFLDTRYAAFMRAGVAAITREAVAARPPRQADAGTSGSAVATS